MYVCLAFHINIHDRFVQILVLPLTVSVLNSEQLKLSRCFAVDNSVILYLSVY